ncbi:MAG: DUF6544 family protein, partial [Bacteroidota bacterium]
DNLSATFTRGQGLLWLTAFLLFSTCAAGYFAGKNFWSAVGVAAVVLSSLLIFTNWSDARFGMIPNVVIAFLVFAGYSSLRMDRMIANETRQILKGQMADTTEIICFKDIEALPFPVRKWIERSGMIGKPAIANAKCHQHALMRMKPDQKEWYEAEALQYTTTSKPAFIWTVALNMSPFMQIRGRDKFVEGKGEMRMRMNDLITVVNETGPKLDEGTLQRYLGELVWMPSLALSPFITWEPVDSMSARATMEYKGVSGTGTFYFGENGDFLRFETLRYMGNDPDAKHYTWVITADDHQEFQGIRVPSQMQATWKLDEGDWTWLKLRITHLRYNV